MYLKFFLSLDYLNFIFIIFCMIFIKDFFSFILILCLYLLQTHFGISSFSFLKVSKKMISKTTGFVHGRLNASWKISCLAVNGQSFLVIDGYLIILFNKYSVNSVMSCPKVIFFLCVSYFPFLFLFELLSFNPSCFYGSCLLEFYSSGSCIRFILFSY